MRLRCRCCGGELEPQEDIEFCVDDNLGYDPTICGGCNVSQGWAMGQQC